MIKMYGLGLLGAKNSRHSCLVLLGCSILDLSPFGASVSLVCELRLIDFGLQEEGMC